MLKSNHGELKNHLQVSKQTKYSIFVHIVSTCLIFGLVAGCSQEAGSSSSSTAKSVPTLTAKTTTTNDISYKYRPYYAVWERTADTGREELALPAVMQASGTSEVILGSITSKNNKCDYGWAGGLDDFGLVKGASINWVKKYVGSTNVTISFGGAFNGLYLEEACSTKDALLAQYKQILNDYQVTKLDFNIEGSEVSRGATSVAGKKRREAIVELIKNNSNLQVGFTVEKNYAISHTGLILPEDGALQWQLAIISGIRDDLKSQGIDWQPAWVNIMPLHMQNAIQGSYADNSIAWAQKLAEQLAPILGKTKDQTREILPRIGIVPAYRDGYNEYGNRDSNKLFNAEEVQALRDKANQAGIGYISPWVINQDNICDGMIGSDKVAYCSPGVAINYQYSKILNPGGKVELLTPFNTLATAERYPISFSVEIIKPNQLKIRGGNITMRLWTQLETEPGSGQYYWGFSEPLQYPIEEATINGMYDLTSPPQFLFKSGVTSSNLLSGLPGVYKDLKIIPKVGTSDEYTIQTGYWRPAANEQPDVYFVGLAGKKVGNVIDFKGMAAFLPKNTTVISNPEPELQKTLHFSVTKIFWDETGYLSNMHYSNSSIPVYVTSQQIKTNTVSKFTRSGDLYNNWECWLSDLLIGVNGTTVRVNSGIINCSNPSDSSNTVLDNLYGLTGTLSGNQINLTGKIHSYENGNPQLYYDYPVEITLSIE